MTKASSAEEYRQIISFHSLGKKLAAGKYEQRLDKALAYWALPSDRRLPLAFLGRTLRELLNQSYVELAATPGVGRKKMGALLRLLNRATKELPGADGFVDDAAPVKKSASERAGGTHEFNPAAVSEAVWEQWRATVRRHGVEHEKLGRLVPSLQLLPTLMWQSPLALYLEHSIVELRQLKTHGEKRISAIIQAFHALQDALGNARVESHLTARLVPKFVLPTERWIAERLRAGSGPSLEETREGLASPLVRQIHVDCGPTLSRLAEARLGLHGAPQTVRAQSKRMGITRARVYQLLEECEQAMNVRWPEGRCQLAALRQRLNAMRPVPAGAEMVRSTLNLFFPDVEEAARRKNEQSADADG
jgi:hypothetical protein